MHEDSSGRPTGPMNETGSNAPPFLTVTELAQRLKATVESQFDFVRIRAEISRPTRAASGHLYFTLKDDRNTLDGVCWKMVAGSLAVQPEEGLEVIVTGKLTIYGG
ncbi:MAG: exodeoxyribonuclease VII large subunit, partial [Candidatus Puniceispirillaceae bacterium]